MVPLVIIAASVIVLIAIAMSGPLVWISLTALALMSVALYVRRRRVAAARDLAVADAPSFGDVLRARNTRDAH
jgi:hypothetical protein